MQIFRKRSKRAASAEEILRIGCFDSTEDLLLDVRFALEGELRAGTGASYSWVGNSEVGEGKMTITESRPSDLVKLKLEFIKPFAATSATEFTFTPSGNATNVKWTMSGDNNFIGKAFSLFMNMDKMIGADFEKGLAQMKKVAESPSK